MSALSARLRIALVTLLCLPALALAATTTPSTLSFGGQSMRTTSPPLTTTFTNNQGAAITISAITVSNAQYAQTNDCPPSLAAAASCTITVTFTPNAAGTNVNDTVNVPATLTITSTASSSPNNVVLSGTAERSLVTHYYRSILRRAPDAGGKTFWQTETTRVVALGMNVNEVWYALSANFFASTEYAAFNRSNNDFVTDLYTTFFNRAPDSAGASFWNTNLSQGMPREVALAEFMFSSEFRNFTQSIFGNTAVRAEVDMATDFFRGLLARLPDDSGFNFWVGKFRTAQCTSAAAVNAEVESISSAFALSAEYSARSRSNAQYVGDLYNSFLRRGGDLAGVQFWIGELNSGARTREQLRVAFKNSTEFQARVNAVIAQGCLGAGKTYYISTLGNDANSGLSAQAPWKTFTKAWQVLVASDTLMVADGTYASVNPPAGKSGAAGQPITIRATNPGGARLGRITFTGNAYLSYIGTRFEGAAPAVLLYSNGTGKPAHHLTFQQISFSCTPNTLADDACFDLGDGTHHVLLEDSWGWGGGRYTIICYGGLGGSPPNVTCDNNTFRRLVLRQGPTRSSGGNPQGSITMYYGSNNIIENVLAIDGNATSDTSNSAFYVTAHSPPPNSDGNKYYGVIALNNKGVGFYLDCSGAICNTVQVHDSVFWDSGDAGMALSGGSAASDTCSNGVLNRNTIGSSGGTGYENYECANATFTNNAVYQNSGYGAHQSSGGGSTPTAHHNGYFGNTQAARQGLPAGTGDITTNPGFQYITRIEAGSPYANAGVSGSIGANVVNRYVDGVLTATPLWPWPFEDRIRAEMCATVTTGWCATTKTLTRYVWEYLGNPIPAGIYP